MLETIRKTIKRFCLDFIQNPYLCYTEHGQHALFYTMLFNTIPEEQRFFPFEGKKVCTLQKEYPTAGKLVKSQRSHWDVAILKSSTDISLAKLGINSYDYLKVFAAIEFGMNATENHLKVDIHRLSHCESNVEHGFIVHLYRLSDSGDLFSNRDWSSKSPRIRTRNQILEIENRKSVEIYYGMADITGNFDQGVWRIKGDEIQEII